MTRQFRHDRPHPLTSDPYESTLDEVRRANLNGRLYTDPPSPRQCRALQLLRAAGLIDRVAATATSLAGWFARM